MTEMAIESVFGVNAGIVWEALNEKVRVPLLILLEPHL